MNRFECVRELYSDILVEQVWTWLGRGLINKYEHVQGRQGQGLGIGVVHVWWGAKARGPVWWSPHEQTEWTDTYNGKYYLPQTSLAGGNEENWNRLVFLILCCSPTGKMENIAVEVMILGRGLLLLLHYAPSFWNWCLLKRVQKDKEHIALSFWWNTETY